MKFFNLTDPRHQQILVEEIIRARRIINEQSQRFSSGNRGTTAAKFIEPVDEAMDINDPVLMKMRAAKMKAANAGDDGNDKFFAKNAARLRKLKALKDKRAQIMRDMEQEAEPEGGPIADRYGDMLNKLDQAIAMLQTPEEKDVDNTVAAPNSTTTQKTVQRLAKWKIASWLEQNAELDALQSYKFNSNGIMQDYSAILNILKSGNPRQSYLKSLIDDLDMLAGVAIDDQDFYDDNSKQIPGRTQDFPHIK